MLSFAVLFLPAVVGHRLTRLIIYLIPDRATDLLARPVAQYIHKQKRMKIQAILSAIPDHSAEKLWGLDSKELNHLYRLASDVFFKKYSQEQAGHRKAQELIREMQARIEHMRARMAELEKKQDKHEHDIRLLREEIENFEKILSNWTRQAA